jgi:hypothetical protein
VSEAVTVDFGYGCHNEISAAPLEQINQKMIGSESMSVSVILMILLVLLLIGTLPTWPHSRAWGYTPSGVLGAVLIVVLVLFLLGRF